MKTLDDKIDDATHAALSALGLSADTNIDTACLLSDRIRELAENAGITGDQDEGEAA